MQMPHHCLLYDVDTGEVLWIFTNGDPRVVQNLAPPIVRAPDGTIAVRATPRCEVLDLTDAYTYEDMVLLHQHFQTTVVRPDGAGGLRLLKRYTALGETIEHTHPVTLARQLRLEVEALAAHQRAQREAGAEAP